MCGVPRNPCLAYLETRAPYLETRAPYLETRDGAPRNPCEAYLETRASLRRGLCTPRTSKPVPLLLRSVEVFELRRRRDAHDMDQVGFGVYAPFRDHADVLDLIEGRFQVLAELAQCFS